MNQAKTEAIAQANAELNNAGLPTYSELLAAMQEALPYINDDPNDPHGPITKIATFLARAGGAA